MDDGKTCLTTHSLVSSDLEKPVDPFDYQFGPAAGQLVNLYDFSGVAGVGCSAASRSHKHTE